MQRVSRWPPRGAAASGGSTLGIVLLVVTMAVCVALSLASSTFLHLSASTREVASRQALSLAESVVARALERLLDDVDYGTGDEVIEVDAAGGRGALSFRTSAWLDGHSLPWSLNNAGNLSPAAGSTRQVPADAVHLVGIGSCGGVRRGVEALVAFPSYPYAIACSAAVQSTGGLCVGALPPDARALDDDLLSNLLPGHMASNGRDEAIRLGPQTRVSGDVQACGRIALDPDGGTKVSGEVRPFADPVPIPQMRAGDFDPEGRSDLQQVGAVLPAARLSGFNRRDGDLQVDGDLCLDGAVLFVDGDLAVRGGLRGNGAVLVRGSARVSGEVSLSADDTVALVSDGDVDLEGVDRTSSHFRGLVYTRGSFAARHISLVGVFVANQDSGRTTLGPAMRIDDANVLLDPVLSRVDVRAAPTTAAPAETLPFCTHCGAYAIHLPDGGHEKSRPILSVSVEVTPQGLRVLDPGSGMWSGPYARDAAEAALISMVERATGHAMKTGRDGHYQGLVGRLDALLGTPDAAAGRRGATLLSIDLNRMLRPAERARLLLWKEVQP